MAASKTKRLGVSALPLVIVPVAFLASAPWLKRAIGDSMTMLVAAAAAIFVMGYGLHLSARWERRLDEVQMASSAYAAKWGWIIGAMTFVLLLLLPPVQNLATSLIENWAGAVVGRKAVLLAMTFGFIGVVLLQTIGLIVVNLFWWRARR